MSNTDKKVLKMFLVDELPLNSFEYETVEKMKIYDNIEAAAKNAGMYNGERYFFLEEIDESPFEKAVKKHKIAKEIERIKEEKRQLNVLVEESKEQMKALDKQLEIIQSNVE